MASLNVLADIRELAARERPYWQQRMDAIHASGVPTNDGPTETVNIDAPISIDSLDARNGAIRGRLAEIDNEFAGQALPDDVRSEWNGLNEEHERNQKLMTELRARAERVRSLAQEPAAREEGFSEPSFHTASPTRGSDPFDYSHIRGAVSLEGQRQLLRDQAMRAVEASRFPHPNADQARCAAAVEHVLGIDKDGEIARRVLNTGSPVYQRAFGKTLQGVPVTAEEQRALGLTNAGGGYAVPYTLDPTIIPTSNGSVNPYRQIARVEQITTTSWQGITSAGVVATRRAEGDEAADNAPTIAQPSVTAQRVDVFIPFSMEIGQDWAGMQAQMARLIQDAKDDEEAASFTTGTGIAPAAQGVVTGATNTQAAAGVASFAAADLYTLESALPARFRARASLVANRFVFNRVRQFDTAGGAQIWTQNLQVGLANQPSGNIGAQVLGYPAYEATSMASALTTGSKIAVFGDFSYFLIVDRVGMDIELIPHLFGANRRPTGQRGIFAVWRNNSKVLDTAAFRTLVTG